MNIIVCLWRPLLTMMPCWPPFLTAGEQFDENTSSCRIKLMSVILSNQTKPSVTALGHPLQMAAHASDWGDSLNERHRGGQMEHHGDDECGGSCVDARWNSCTILSVGNLRSGSFLFLPKSFFLVTQTFSNPNRNSG